jgi:hypothetical protein
MLSKIGRQLCDADQIVVNDSQMAAEGEFAACVGCRKSLQIDATRAADIN